MLLRDAGIPERTRLGIWFAPLVGVPFPRPRLEPKPIWLWETGVTGPVVLVLGGEVDLGVNINILLLEAELALDWEGFLGWCWCVLCCDCCWVAEL